MAKAIKCNFYAEDCCNYRDGICKALQEQFSRYCPFYKTKAQYEAEVKKCNERLGLIVGKRLIK